MEMPLSKRLDTSTPVAAITMMVPRDVLSEKLSIMGEARVRIKLRQKVISEPIITKGRSPSLSVSAR